MKQKFFDYKIQPKKTIEDFYVSNSNRHAFNYVLNENEFIKYCFIRGPKKSGKTHLGLIWKKNNQATIFNSRNFNHIIQNKKNVFIDDFSQHINEEYLFHLINHCFNHKLKILICSEKLLSDHNFNLIDLNSRLKTFHFIEINEPDDDLITNLVVKLLYDKQIIITNPDIVNYILTRIDRTYYSINLLIDKLDKLSLEKKRQITIPLIKELI